MKAGNYSGIDGILISNAGHREGNVKQKPPISPTGQVFISAPEADGSRFGDWEMDLIVDGSQNAILVLVERLTNFVMLERLKHSKKAEPLAQTVIRSPFPYRKTLKSITIYNGIEFADHLTITRKLGVIVYFADSYCSWQKGAVEHQNKLIRQYIPKKSNFNDFSDQYISNIGKKLNLRPRKKISYSNPKTEFFKQINKFALAS